MTASRKEKLRGRELTENYPEPVFDESVRGCLGHLVRLSRSDGESYGQIASTSRVFDAEVVDFIVGKHGGIKEVLTRVVMPGLAADGIPCKITPRDYNQNFVKLKGRVILLFWRKLSRRERSIGSSSTTCDMVRKDSGLLGQITSSNSWNRRKPPAPRSVRRVPPLIPLPDGLRTQNLRAPLS